MRFSIEKSASVYINIMVCVYWQKANLQQGHWGCRSGGGSPSEIHRVRKVFTLFGRGPVVVARVRVGGFGEGRYIADSPPPIHRVNNLNDTTGRPASVLDDLRYFPVGWRLAGARAKGTYYYYIDPFRYIELYFLVLHACFARIISYNHIYFYF